MNNKKRVWSAFEKLWYGISLRNALDITGADILLFFKEKREQYIYIPAFNKTLHKEEFNLLVEIGKDLILKDEKLRLINYEK